MTSEARLDLLERKCARITRCVIVLCIATPVLWLSARGRPSDTLELVDPRKGWRCEICMQTEDVANGKEDAEVRCQFFDEEGTDLGAGAFAHSNSRTRR
jgi:hypothetical protein